MNHTSFETVFEHYKSAPNKLNFIQDMIKDLNFLPLVNFMRERTNNGSIYSPHKFGDGTLMLSFAGERSRNRGSVPVQNSMPYGENEFYGRIYRDGTFQFIEYWTERAIADEEIAEKLFNICCALIDRLEDQERVDVTLINAK